MCLWRQPVKEVKESCYGKSWILLFTSTSYTRKNPTVAISVWIIVDFIWVCLISLQKSLTDSWYEISKYAFVYCQCDSTFKRFFITWYLILGDGEEGIGTVQNVAPSQITLDPNLQYQFRTDTGELLQNNVLSWLHRKQAILRYLKLACKYFHLV